MEYQRVTKSAQKEQSKTPSSSLHQTSLNHVGSHPLLDLQRTIGNQAVLNMLRSQNEQPTQTSIEPRFSHDFSQIPIHSPQTAASQTKLEVNQPGDVYEQEADWVAEQVMRTTDLHTSVSDNQDHAKHYLMREQSREPGANAATQSPSVPPIIHDVLNSGGGQPLDATTRAFMEPRFGHDFSQVRVHADTQAAESARAVNALAYTVGQDIVFGEGQYRRGTGKEQMLLAHELTHVVQQNSLPLQNKIQRQSVQMASGRYVGDIGGAVNNTREEVLQAMDRLHFLWSISNAEYDAEYPIVSALSSGSPVPIATIPNTIRALSRNETPTLNLPVAKYFLNITLSDNVGRGQTNNKNDILSLQDALHISWNIPNSDYSTERTAVNAISTSTIPEAVIPQTINGIAKMKTSIVAGTFRRGLFVSTRTGSPPKLEDSGGVRFSDVQRRWAGLATQAEKDSLLNDAVASARLRAHVLSRNANADPVKSIHDRVVTDTAIILEANPFNGIPEDKVEQAYRAWALGAGEEPWILLALWRKEGANERVSDTIATDTITHARSLYRSQVYYIQMGLDHYTQTAATSGDNTLSTNAEANEQAFHTAVSAQVAAGRLARDISSDINAELMVTMVSPGQFRVTPSSLFYSLSLMLAGAYYRENETALATDPRVGASPDPGLVYMRWNMGSTRFAPFLPSAETHRMETAYIMPGGAHPSIAQWAFERHPREHEFDQPRRNAIRFRYFLEVFRLAYEGW